MKTNDIYQDVTNQIIAALETGVAPWTKSWNSTLSIPHNASSNRMYNGVNVLITWLSGYNSQGWVTYGQAKKMGGQVKKGEKSTRIIHYKMITVGEGDDKRTFPKVTPWSIFNTEQCEGIELPEAAIQDRDTTVTLIADKNKVNVKYDGSSPRYIPSEDQIRMPAVDDFNTEKDFEATLLHEMIHWTKTKKRLHRELSYAEEELVAELGAAFAGARLGFTLENLQHDSYIDSWLKLLKGDDKAIFKAAKQAQKAVEFILGKQTQGVIIEK